MNKKQNLILSIVIVTCALFLAYSVAVLPRISKPAAPKAVSTTTHVVLTQYPELGNVAKGDKIEYEQTTALDSKNIIDRYSLPALDRMSKEDTASLISNLQVVKKFNALKLKESDILTPFIKWKTIYNNDYKSVSALVYNKNRVNFTGTKTSELNAFIAANPKKIIKISAATLSGDATIKMANNTYISGNSTEIVPTSNLNELIDVSNCKNVGIEGFVLDKNYNYGIYVKNGSNILIRNNVLQNASKRPVVVMGNASQVYLINNYLTNNAQGGIFLRGKVSKSIIENNMITANKGTSNYMAGIILTDVPVSDLENPDQNFTSGLRFDATNLPLDQKTDGVNTTVVKNNIITDNMSSGIYSDGAYECYLVGNTMDSNDKEGMCLDGGSVGNFVYGNTITHNGERKMQSDDDLKQDSVFDLGRMSDGSSKAKLPGVSIDNSAYNILLNNNVTENSGSGIKMVRTGVANIIGENEIDSNNMGQNDKFHGFGIELGNASGDTSNKSLDFTPDFENIVFSNTISGGHYSGIFISENCYINDFFDNVIHGCTMFSMECISNKLNSSVNNNSNVKSRGIGLSNESYSINLPGRVN